MARLLLKEEQQKLDHEFSELTGLPPIVLMEQAASGLSGMIESLLDSFEPRDENDFDVLFVAGPGRNGGDGWASARQLMAQGYEVIVYDAAKDFETSGDVFLNKSAYRRLGGKIVTERDELQNSLPLIVVDALFGTGFDASKPLSDRAKAALSLMADLKEKDICVVACDIPSGVDANTGYAVYEAVKADFTGTFGRKKVGLVTHPGLLYAGEVMEFPISMSDEFVEHALERERYVCQLDADSASDKRKDHAPDGHKGQFGRVMLIGGAEGMTGALILAARATEKMGVGYTMLRAPEAQLPIIASAVPSALLSSVPEEGMETKRDLPEPDVIAIGSGAGKDPWVKKAINHLLRQPMPIIIDADGLNALSRMMGAYDILKERYEKGLPPAVLTPHPGEFLRLAPESSMLLSKDRAEAARELAQRTGSIIVLKGMATVVAMPDGDVYINSTGNVGLAKGGSGDVLTGMIAGLAAQMDSIFDAVKRAVYLHGLVADIASEKYLSETVITPEDLIATIGEALLC